MKCFISLFNLILFVMFFLIEIVKIKFKSALKAKTNVKDSSHSQKSM